MALLNLNFTQDEVKNAQSDNYAPIPAGNYTAEITRSEVKQTKDGRGSYLSLSFKIIEGEFAGRLIFQNITLTNANATAQTIGHEQMAQLAGACGVLQLQDSQQLHGIAMTIRVAIETDKTGQYEPRNAIKKFMPYQQSLQLQNTLGFNQGFNAAQQSVTSITSHNSNPWARQG